MFTVLAGVVLMALAAAAAFRAQTAPDTTNSVGFAIGDRVRVSDRYHWAKGAEGTVAPAPDSVRATAPGWIGHQRVVPAATARVRLVWVSFDVPQRAINGERPIEAGEIDVAHLARLSAR